jgi:hypothetical protein
LAEYGVSITKEVNFRGAQQPFSNIYYYNNPAIPEIGPANDLLDSLIPIEKDLHSALVTFVEARVWSAGGTALDNEMIVIRDLSGGGVGSSQEIDPERAILIQWPAGVDIRGLPVYLRKWYHSMGTPAAATAIPTFSNGQVANQDPILQSQRDAIATVADRVQTAGSGGFGDFRLVSKTDRGTQGPAECHRWLEHHQLGDQWRV